MRRRAAALLLALAALGGGAGCGYGAGAGLRLHGGVRAVSVAPFENRSTDPGVAAALTAALRRELARRGAEGAGARLEGEVRTGGAAATLPGGATARVVLEARARLVVDGAVAAERTVRREADHLAGADALEGEARRGQALQRLAAEVARALVESLEE